MNKYFRLLLEWPGMGRQLSLLVLLSIVGALLEGAGIGLLVPVLDALQNPTFTLKGDRAEVVRSWLLERGIPLTLPIVLLVVVSVFIFRAGVVYARQIIGSRTQFGFQNRLQVRAFSHLTGFDLGFFHRSRAGDIINNFTIESERAAYSVYLVGEMAAALFLIGIYLAIQLTISPTMAVVSLSVLATLAYFLRPQKAYQSGIQISKGNDDLQSTALEAFNGIREVKVFGLETEVQKRFVEIAREVSVVYQGMARGGFRFTLFFQCTVVFVLASLILLGSRWAGLPFSSLLVFLLTLQRMTPQVQSFIDKRHWWLGSLSAFEKVNRLIEETHPNQSVIAKGQERFVSFTKSIEFSSVSFRHAGRPGNVLSDVSFSIPHGNMVAVVGPSGAGKSTLLDLLARFYDPIQGSVRVDGRDVKEFDLVSWRGALGLVSQDTFLFHETLENNIRFGRQGASPDEVREAARKAYIDTFIAELPQGYQTVVGDRGVTLSGGQRQRIALARAILRRPQILLLDEATSDLDSESEYNIQRALQELNRHCTIVAVAHRLSTIEKADRIVVLQEGRVVEVGTHSELLVRNGRYAQLHRLQNKKDRLS